VGVTDPEPTTPVPNPPHLYDHPPGHGEVTVKPGVPDAPSVGLHADLHRAHLTPLRAALHLGESRDVTADTAKTQELGNWWGLGRARPQSDREPCHRRAL